MWCIHQESNSKALLHLPSSLSGGPKDSVCCLAWIAILRDSKGLGWPDAENTLIQYLL